MSTTQCRGKLYDDKPCPREVVKGSEWCIFHFPEKTGKLIQRFMKEFRIEMEKQMSDHSDYYDFTGFDFPQKINFDSRLPVTFFDSAIFRDYQFFTDIVFQELARFNNAIFEKTAFFNGAIFEEDAEFESVTFKKNADFIGVNFKGPTWFQWCVFTENALFKRLKVSAEMHFYRNIIEREFSLLISEWSNQPKEKKSRYSVRFNDPIIKEYGKVFISGKLGIINAELLAGISLLNTELSKIEFIDETWPRKKGNGRKIIIDEVFLKQNIEEKIDPHDSLTPDQVAQTYRRLRENYEKAKRYSDAGDFLIGEMEIIRNYKTSQEGRSEKRSMLDSTGLLYSLYYILGQYGESIGIPLFWSLSVILLATEYHCLFTYQTFTLSQLKKYLPLSLSKSILTFFPFSRPENVLDLFLHLFGLLLLGITFIAVKRRLERR